MTRLEEHSMQMQRSGEGKVLASSFRFWWDCSDWLHMYLQRHTDCLNRFKLLRMCLLHRVGRGDH
jgi:hypothetical protein